MDSRRFERPALRWHSEPDRGIYDAMNKGLRLATGDLIGCLNADDVFADAEVLARVVAAAEQAHADAVYGDLVYVRANAMDQVLRHWRSGPFEVGRLAWGWMPPHPTFYIRKHALERVGEYNASLRIAADYDWMLRALSLPGFRVAYVPQVLVPSNT